MPELSEDMYCSQQIMVPPMFPYILRQYAKAAIRSQPTDLLRWSTAYFRCLSLNLPPPVKPRLEYPLPKDYDGITPGWLKAMLYQFQSNTYIDYKNLWNHWVGACQNHGTLLKILCLSNFTNPGAIPLYRFLGMCAAFLSENLTQTMILFCEIITEEPEGGSCMIRVETFIDVYAFLASINASEDQILLNRFFVDDLLDLEEKVEEKKEVKKKKIKVEAKEISIKSESVEEEEKVKEERGDAISCPDLVEVVADGGDLSKEPSTILSEVDLNIRKSVGDQAFKDDMDIPFEEYGEGENEPPAQVGEDESVDRSIQQSVEEPTENVLTANVDDDVSYLSAQAHATKDADVESEEDEEELEQSTAAPVTEEVKPVESEQEGEDKKSSSMVEGGEAEVSSKQFSLEEFEKLNYEDKTITDFESQGYGLIRAEEAAEEEAPHKYIPQKFVIEEVFVERIPGVGAPVPEELVKAVIKYMKTCAEKQQGMVMPRNIRHYSCPPLEAY